MEHHGRGDELSFALHLADLAAEITVPAFGARLPITLKADASPVTAADAAAERRLRLEITAAYPQDAILGEEEGATAGTSGRTWIIDPIDGTRMFAEGIPLWSTLIALKEHDQLVVGVADAPAVSERYHAVLDTGAFCNGARIATSDVMHLADALVLHAPLEEFARGTGLPALTRVSAGARATRGIGDAWAHLLVARGAADVLVEQGPCFEWDWAATQVIVHEAGGRLTSLHGGEPRPGDHLLVSNGRLDDEVRAALLG